MLFDLIYCQCFDRDWAFFKQGGFLNQPVRILRFITSIMVFSKSDEAACDGFCWSWADFSAEVLVEENFDGSIDGHFGLRI